MLESIFLFVMATGVIMLVLAIERENMIYNAISMLCWFIVMGAHLGIEVPAEDTPFTEPFLLAVCVGFIAINIIWAIILLMDFSYWKKQP